MPSCPRARSCACRAAPARRVRGRARPAPSPPTHAPTPRPPARRRSVVFQWVGPNVSRLATAKAIPTKAAVFSYFQGHHLALEIYERDALSEADIEKRLRAAGGAHQPSDMQFPGNGKAASVLVAAAGSGSPVATAPAAAPAAAKPAPAPAAKPAAPTTAVGRAFAGGAAGGDAAAARSAAAETVAAVAKALELAAPLKAAGAEGIDALVAALNDAAGHAARAVAALGN